MKDQIGEIVAECRERAAEWEKFAGESLAPCNRDLWQSTADMLNKAADKLEALGGWQDISTAPKDGTFILCCHESGHINVMQFCADGYWRSGVRDRWNEPPHWQPLPAQPKEGCDEQ